MLIIYDQDRLSLNSVTELYNVEGHWMNGRRWEVRSPMIAQFFDKKERTSFLVMVNHLARTDVQLRDSQATGLRLWAEEQTLPIIGLGRSESGLQFFRWLGNSAFDKLFADGTLNWVKPKPSDRHQLVRRRP